MNRITVGDYAIDTDAVVWANTNFFWKEEVVSYVTVNGFKVRDNVKFETRGGIFLRFVDGSTLTIPDGTDGIMRLRAILDPAGRMATMPEDAYSPIENEILTGLPEDLRAAILKGEQ